MSRMVCIRFLFLVAVLFLSVTTAWAQYGASMEGTVTDKAGAVIPGATVTVTNQATGVNRKTVTGDSGFYRISGLPPGRYTVVVEAASFKKQSSPDVLVTAEAVKGFDVALQPEQAQEVVTVTEGSEALQTESASVTGTITSQEVLELPQFGRDPYNLIRLTPGVFGDASRQGNGNALTLPQQVGPGGSNSEIFQTENQVQVVSNGQRVTANNYMLDGVSVNSLDWGGAAVITPNQESVQEVVVASNSYSAQDGRNSGAQVKVVSRSGANAFHGSGVIKFNDKGLNAFNRFEGPTNLPATNLTCEANTPSEFKLFAHNCPSRVNQKYRQFAGSLGGPIVKDRLFFFFSYEGLRQRNTSISRSVKLETPQFEQYVTQVNPNSIAATLFSTPGIAARISTVVSETDCCSLITDPSDPNYHPVGMWYVPGTGIGQAIGNGPDGIPDWGFYDLTLPSSSSGDQYNGRVDYTQGNNQFFVSSYTVRFDNFAGGQRPIEDLTLQPHSYVGTFGWTRTFGATLLNEFRANFTRWTFNQLQPQGQTNYGIPQIRLFDFDAGGLTDAGRMIGIARSSTTPGNLAQNTFAFTDSLSWVRNHHAFKFGGEARREQNNNNQVGGERPDYQFRGLLNLANDACCFFEEITVNPTNGQPPDGQRYFRTSDYALFVQDDWKVRPNLTLNLGLRWEYFPPVTETKDRVSNYIFGSQGVVDGSVQTVKQLFDPDRNNFGPRFGFAWSPAKDQGKLVFRGGFGVLFNRHFGVEFSNIRQNTPFVAEASACCFFDPGQITGPPPGSNILYALGSSAQANSYPANPNLSFGLAPDGALCGDTACSFVTKVDIFGALPKEPNPYVYAFSYQVQMEPARDWVATLGYQGSRSRKLVRTIDINRLMPGDTFDGSLDRFQNTGSNGNPCDPTNPTCSAPHATGNNRFNRIFFPLPDVNASFDAAIFQLSRRFSHGFQFSSNYTWSHTIDTTSYEIGYQQTDPGNQAIDRANSDYDVRHNWSLSGLWELPFLRNRRDFVGSVLGGWIISGILSRHSGFPFGALIGSCDTNNDRNGDGYCPDQPSAYFGGAIDKPSKQQWVNGIFPNPSAEFDITTKGPGCRCRNIFTGPGYTSVDLTAGKSFALPTMAFFGEGAKLELRANFFNAFNILNLSPLIPASAPTDILNVNPPNPQFGRAPDGLAGRVIEFQARFSF